MPLPLDQRLRARGWDEKEIEQVLDTLYSEEKQKKHELYKQNAAPLLYWTGLLILIIGNLFFAVVLVPVLIFLTSFQLYAVIAIMGVTFGIMYDFLIRDIEHVDEKHHIIAGIFIPTIALITIAVMVQLANDFAARLGMPVHQSTILVTLIYVTCFTLPYASMKLYERMASKKYSQTQS
ncbi:hypothetical protein D6774_01750 [Candidatus Woesearchaeota archaeon]|jgi:uncharacterized membrane protein|nr:MAG: hypothetical protein D6774_01750 [Candidatus Woesearchaeota archaeon]